MDVRALIIDVAEKISLVATAALVAVLVPQLRHRLLDVGPRRDKLAALVFGVALSMWGAKLGFEWLGENINIRGIGIFIAAVLGGRKAGFAAGLAGGLFYVFRVEPADGPWGVVGSTMDGLLAGLVAHYLPRLFQGWRAFGTCSAIQALHVVVVGAGLWIAGDASVHAASWPAHLTKLLANSAGLTLFVVVARVVMAREEAAVALVEARAAADAAALEALRRRLEPHFLFNALNTLRATIRTDPKRARELVSDLADLYRYLLTHPEDAPLKDEVDHACAYLAIERARLGDGRLRVETDVDPGVEHVRVPALLLQPLVENAVKHGISKHEGEGVVSLKASRRDDTLVVAVRDYSEGALRQTADDADEDDDDRDRSSGIALETLRERLTKRFGRDAVINLRPDTGGMQAEVRLPWPAIEETTRDGRRGRTAA